MYLLTTNNKLLFTLGAVLAALLVVLLIIAPLFFTKLLHHKFNFKVYRKLYRIAMHKDFYLINNYPLIKDGIQFGQIDHLLFTDKFIYVINDKVLNGVISGKKIDNVWISYDLKGNKSEFYNPLIINNRRLSVFSETKEIDERYMISVVVLNNDVKIKNLNEMNTENSVIIRKKDLNKLISLNEKRNVGKFKLDKLDLQVKELAKDIYKLEK